MIMFLKSSNGATGCPVGINETLHFFKANTDSKGNVTKDVVLFKDAMFKSNTDGSISWVLSDETLDRDFEQFDTAGWTLAEFKKNPVVLWSHDYGRPAIGRVLNPHTRSGRLVGKVQFDPDDVFAQEVERKVKSGYIKAGSVGFFPIQVEIPEDDKSDLKLIYRKQELREFSVCNVPANPNALVQLSAAGPSKDINFYEGLMEPDYAYSSKVDLDEPWAITEERMRQTMSGLLQGPAQEPVPVQEASSVAPDQAIRSGFKTMFKD